MCGALRASHTGQEVTVCGWVQTIREIGGLVFIDLRDREGTVQLVFDKEVIPKLHEQAKRLAREWVIGARGKVSKRSERQVNKNLPTGEVEVIVSDLEIHNSAETPPIEVRDDVEANSDIRLTYRYVDLRRPKMQHIFQVRHKLAKAARDYFDAQGFLEIETPLLTKPTPEGARDFLVPSRHYPGSFYALPQSPQIFKQILMMSGFDKYFQIARNFRDEDKRADRQPEHTQIDVELSFVEPADVQKVIEGLIAHVMKAVMGVEVKLPLPHMSYAEATASYGIDRPDLRFGMQLVDLSEIVKDCGFGVFADTVKSGKAVKALLLPGGHEKISKGQFKNLEADAKGRGAKGLAFIRYTADGVDSPIAKFIGEAHMAKIKEKTGANAGDMLIFVADHARLASQILGAYRNQFGAEFGLIQKEGFRYLWVDDFPQFAYDEEKNEIVPEHHPFVMPKNEDAFMAFAEEFKRNDRKANPRIVDLALAVTATQYDIIVNGIELGSGSQRIVKPSVQNAMFDCLGMTREQANAKFGFLLEALKYGAPPMAGIGMGVDRWMMALFGIDNIQEVVVFPKHANARGMMDGSPSPAEEAQLKELGIALREEK